jgi:hypothetical protein
MNPLYHGDNESKQHYEGLEKLTDRELQEKQAYYLWKIERSNERIKLNLQFWFYLAIVSAALFVIISLQK